MRTAVFMLAGFSVLVLGMGCCHHCRGCYDSSTGLVRRGGMFDTCNMGSCDSECDDRCDRHRCRWFDFYGSSCLRKHRSCKRHRNRDCDCSCERHVEQSPCGCGQDHYGSNGALIPYEGTYVDGGMVYDGQVIYEGASSDCPTCNSTSPMPTYAPAQPYPELRGVPQQNRGEPSQAPPANPMHETSITIPPVSYSVPAPLQSGPHIPQLQRIGAQ